MADTPTIQQVFADALARPAGPKRAAYLEEACRGNADLRRRVDRLLRASDDAESFLESPAVEQARTIDQPLEHPGKVIGPYKLLQQIGEGGMGVVYMAEQQEPVERRVALKIIKPGMDSRQVIARFEAERQALAMMDHPNIARVFDAGTTESGRPFFVMELVRGIPITQYCDEYSLPIRERLELFATVCQAIQHAHTKGIIHRDVKPTNLLIAEYDEQPVPKVIDFGVAKATDSPLTEKTMFTSFGQIVGTLEYMSPEQAKLNQLDVDTRSDIYSLGVLLYELLTGSTPFDKARLRSAGWDEILRIIREEEPPKPSTRLSSNETLPCVAANRSMELPRLSRTVRGELDWIVMKALEKDRNRRYETAGSFAQDLQRYLANEPVHACPPTAGYRLRKLVSRNRGPVFGAILVLVALVAGIFGTTWGMIRADLARDQAQARLAQVEKATEILASVFQDVDPIAAEKAGLTSRDLLGKRLVTAAQQLEGEAVGDPLVVARLQHLLGISLRELRHLREAEELLVKARQTRERLLGADHLDTVATKHHLAILYRSQGSFSLAETLFDEVLAIRTAKLGADDLESLATKHHVVVLYRSQRRYALAEALCKEVLASRTAKLGADDLDTIATKHNLGTIYLVQEKYDLAEALLQEVVAGRTARLGPDYPDTLTSRHHLALVYHTQKKHDLAEALLQEVVAGRTARLGAAHFDTLDSQDDLASLYVDQGKFALAEALYKETLAAYTALLGADHLKTIFSSDRLAELYGWSMKRFDQSIPLLEESLERRKSQQDPDDPEILGRQVTLGAHYCEAGRFADGIALIEEVRQKGRSEPHPAWVRSVLLTAYVQAGRTAEATALVEEQVQEARQRLTADSRTLAAVLADNGKVLLHAKAYAEAEALLLEAYQGLKQTDGENHLRNVLDWLVELYDARGKPDEAAKWRNRFVELEM